MIRVDDIEQGTPEWKFARLAIPTASEFGRIVTPTGKSSSQAEDYMNKLLAEWVRQKSDEGYLGKFMKDGHIHEPAARATYEFQTDRTVETTGIVYKDEDRLVACSPDGLSYIAYPTDTVNGNIDRGLEIKCPTAGVHIGYIRDRKCPATYVPQVQGSMWVTDLNEWDFESWHQDINPLIVAVPKDEVYQAALDRLIPAFIERMLEAREKLAYILGIEYEA